MANLPIHDDDIVWDGDVPRPKVARKLSRDTMNELARCSLSLPYQGIWDSESQRYVIPDPLYVGKSVGEVLLLQMASDAINGNEKARTELLDRVMGKPKQSVDATVTTMTFNDFLEMSAMEAGDIIDVESQHDTDVLNDIEGV